MITPEAAEIARLQEQVASLQKERDLFRDVCALKDADMTREMDLMLMNTRSLHKEVKDLRSALLGSQITIASWPSLRTPHQVLYVKGESPVGIYTSFIEDYVSVFEELVADHCKAKNEYCATRSGRVRTVTKDVENGIIRVDISGGPEHR